MLHAYPVEVGMDWMGYAMLKSKKVPEPRSIRLKVIYAQFNPELQNVSDMADISV